MPMQTMSPVCGSAPRRATVRTPTKAIVYACVRVTTVRAPSRAAPHVAQWSAEVKSTGYERGERRARAAWIRALCTTVFFLSLAFFLLFRTGLGVAERRRCLDFLLGNACPPSQLDVSTCQMMCC